MKFHASDIQLSSEVGGDYLHINFSESDEEECPYALFQNSFEFQRSPCYFECHDYLLSGHGKIKRCELKRSSIEIDLKDSSEHISITFNEPDEKIANIGWILEMIFIEDRSFFNKSGVPNKPLDQTRP